MCLSICAGRNEGERGMVNGRGNTKGSRKRKLGNREEVDSYLPRGRSTIY